ncbi:MAG: LamG domain-containing protein [bacterium]|nr:LamG domain-containing protein [bacterium]
MKKYFKFIALFLLFVPVLSFADYAGTVRLLGQARQIESSAGSLLTSNSSLRSALDSLYQLIIKLLQADLTALASRTTSVSFDMITTPLSKGSLVNISFKRVPSDSSSPVSFSMEADGKALGSLSNELTANSFSWQVADNLIISKNYVVVAKNKDGKTLGTSNSFTVSSSIVSVVPTSAPILPILPVPAPSPTPAPAPLSNEVGSSDINFGSLGYWSFDRGGNSCDTKGGANTNADGRLGTALGLNGTDAYCVAANNRTFYPNNFTLALWAKSAPAFTSGWNDSSWFVSLRDRSGYSIGPVKGTKDVKFTIFDDTNLTQVPFVVGTVTPDNITDWHHYAVTYNGTVANIYLDGVLMTSTTVTIPRNNSTSDEDLYFGLDNVPGQPKGAGTLDEIRLYNRPMTACEIRFLAGKGCSGIANAFDSSSNLASVLSAF